VIRRESANTDRPACPFLSLILPFLVERRECAKRRLCLSIPLSPHGYCHANWAPSERLLLSRPLRAPVGVPTDALRVHCLLGRGGARLASQPVGRPPPGSGFGERRVSVCVCVCVCVCVFGCGTAGRLTRHVRRPYPAVIVFSASAHTGVDDSSPWLPCEEDATTSTMFDCEAALDCVFSSRLLDPGRRSLAFESAF